MKYNLSEKALQRISEISDYISYTLRNKQAAIKFIDSIIEKMETVCLFPLANKDFSIDGTQYRRTFINDYVLIYHIKEDIITVDTVQYAGQNPDNIMRDLKQNKKIYHK